MNGQINDCRISRWKDRLINFQKMFTMRMSKVRDEKRDS